MSEKNVIASNEQTNVIDFTYEWLSTAFPEVPKLTGSEVYRKNNDIRNLLIEELEEFMYAPNLDEKFNALADIRVVVLNFPFYTGVNSHEITDTYNYLFSDRKRKPLLESVNKLIDLVLNTNDLIYSKHIVVEILALTNDIASYLIAINKLENNRLYEEDYYTYMSNMTKFCLDEQEAKDTVKLYATGNHPNKKGSEIETIYEYTGHDKWKYRIMTPGRKIMKSKSFIDVDKIKEEGRKQYIVNENSGIGYTEGDITVNFGDGVEKFNN